MIRDWILIKGLTGELGKGCKGEKYIRSPCSTLVVACHFRLKRGINVILQGRLGLIWMLLEGALTI